MIYESVSREMAILLKETEMLPPYTPMFVSEPGGRIVEAKNLKAAKDDFLSVARIISIDERKKYLFQSEACDCLVMKTKTDEKELLVLTKTKGDFSHGVICSYSENNCIRLDDYFEKLLSYRDYLDYYARLSAVPEMHMPAMKLFEVRIGGAAQLLELSRVGFRDEECIEFPLQMLIQKVAKFVANVSENSAVCIDFCFEEDRFAKIPLSFLGLVVSCISLAIRHSRDAHIIIGTKNINNGQTLLAIETRCAFSAQTADIYEDAVTGAFANMGIGFNVLNSKEVYSIQIKLETVERAKEMLSDEDEITRLLSGILSDSSISELVYTILP